MTYVFFPEYGMTAQWGTLAVLFDHIDMHTTSQTILPIPGIFLRKDITMQQLIKKGK